MQPNTTTLLDLDDVQDKVAVSHTIKGVKRNDYLPLLDVMVSKNITLSQTITELKQSLKTKDDEITLLTNLLGNLELKLFDLMKVVDLQNESVKAIAEKLSMEGRI